MYIYGNKDPCIFNKYYEQNYIGYIYLGFEGNENQNLIYENDIKITIEDLDNFLYPNENENKNLNENKIKEEKEEEKNN